MPINSRQKGKRIEREAAKAWQHETGWATRRGQQYNGVEGEDIVTECQELHLEVKGVEKLNLYAAMEQSREDSGPNQIPLVLHKRNGKEWLLTCYLDNLTQLHTFLRQMPRLNKKG